MPLRREFLGIPQPLLAAKGISRHDFEALTPVQRECIDRLGKTVQMEQEAYLSQHPEVLAMLEMFIGKVVHDGNRKSNLATAAKYFTRPTKELDADIRSHLELPSSAPYLKDNTSRPYSPFDKFNLVPDLKAAITKVCPPDTMTMATSAASTMDTLSSSFLSAVTSDTTLPTPEPIPTPEPTLSEAFLAIIANTVDKAVYLHVDEGLLKYDTAYVEVMKSVEEAMEVPVIEIREDIAELLFSSYENFEADIMEKERIAAELAWERRMRKKMKRTLRRVNNFKGYESPPSLKSAQSEAESEEIDRRPPPHPCICHPQYRYNRYPKDRFGIYLPGPAAYCDDNITATPAFSIESIPDHKSEPDKDTKSTGGKSNK